MGMLDDPRKLDTLFNLHQNDSRWGWRNTCPLSHTWSRSLIADMFQDGLKEWITEAVVLAEGEAILFFERWSHKEGLSYTSAGHVWFSLTGPVTWAGRTVQVEATANMVQEGLQAIADAVMEKKMMVRRVGHPQGLGKTIQSLAGACNVDDWMQGLDEGVSDWEVRRTGDSCTQCIVAHDRWCQQQRAPRIPRGSPRGSPSLGGESSDRGSD